MAILSISGYTGSGKDTVGAIIQYLLCKSTGTATVEEIVKDYAAHEWWLEEQSGFERRKWASKLKQIASILTGIPVEKFEDQEFKKTELGKEWDIIDGNNGCLVPMTVRQFLQKLGTEALRDGLHQQVWINALMSEYKPTATYRMMIVDFSTNEEWEEKSKVEVMPHWIITDTRYENEAQAVRDAGGVLIRVIRKDTEAVNLHPSETSLDSYEFDHVIYNDGSLEDLVQKVQEVLIKENLLHVYV